MNDYGMSAATSPGPAGIDVLQHAPAIGFAANRARRTAMTSIRIRVGRMRRAVEAGRPPGPHVVLINRSGNRPPGMHRLGPPGSLATAWSLGPDGSDDMPPAGIPPFALVIGGEVDPDAV
jgi:hypothetical protein